MGNSKGFRDSLRELMNSKKSKLFTSNDLVEELVAFDPPKAKTILYQMWKKGDIQRHKVDDADYGPRYAMTVSEDNIRPYEVTRVVNVRRASKEPITKEEAEIFFQDIQNACLTFDSILSKCLEFETRFISQIEENDKTVSLLQEMKSRMAQIRFP